MVNVKNITNEKEIDILMAEEFGFPDFESFEKDFYEKIDRAHEDIKKGKYKTAEKWIQEMEEKYKIYEEV